MTAVDTPAVVLDLDVFERNAAAISGFLHEAGLAWRPHTKAHKSPRLAQLQLAAGAIGVTCAKVGEAEVMVAGGIGEVLVANHLGRAGAWRRVAALQRAGRVIVCVDDAGHVRQAAEAAAGAAVTIPLLVEVDVGMRRVGVRSVDAARALAELIARSPGVTLAGVMGYEGHLLREWPAAEKRRRCAAALSLLTDVADALRLDGHPVDIVSAGGTGTYRWTADLPGLTESQAGGGCLMDRFYAEDCHVPLEFALTVATTVVSVQAEGRAIVDAGFKALGVPMGFAGAAVLGHPEVQVPGLSAEHGILDGAVDDFHVGDRLLVVPSYSDAMLFLHDQILGCRGGVVSEVIPVAGRGRLT